MNERNETQETRDRQVEALRQQVEDVRAAWYAKLEAAEKQACELRELLQDAWWYKATKLLDGLAQVARDEDIPF